MRFLIPFIGILQILQLVSAKIVTSSDGIKIYAEAAGDPKKPSIVLVHGITGSALSFNELVQNRKLLDKFYLVSYDLRGHGRSDKPITTEAYVSKRFADDFAAVTSAFKLKAPVVLGWSYGGTVFADIFSNLPANSVSALIGINAIPYTGIPNVNTATSLAIVPNFFVMDNVSVHVNSKVALGEAGYNDPDSVPYAIKAASLGAAIVQPGEVTALCLTRTQDRTALHAAGAKGFPLLMLAGTNDRVLLNEAIINATTPYFSKVQVRRIKGGSHRLFYDFEEEVVKNIIDFYTGLNKVEKPNKKLPKV